MFSLTLQSKKNHKPHLLTVISFLNKALGKTLLVIALLGVTNVIQAKPPKPIAIVIHGGAGVIDKSKMSPEKEKAYREKLQQALQSGYKTLEKGGSSLDAIQNAIVVLEDSPLFNSGKGAVYTHDETHELDASIMDGKTLAAGAAAGVSTVKNPIILARAIMEKSKHVMMAGDGADNFAKSLNLELVDNSYFDTPERLESLRKIKKKDPNRFKLGQTEVILPIDNKTDDLTNNKFGTVGAVALDQFGNLAAGTSTGGMTNKRFGRIGDSPIIGAGTYADNKSCAVSATGHGEYFIRSVVAYDICAIKYYKKVSLQEAAKHVIQKKLIDLGGDGGIIAMDTKANIVTEFNTPGMFRGYIDANGNIEIKIYK